MPRKTDKRCRLVEAAKLLIHQQGFNLTTLADIAQEADVPLGNVYYYFKTKEAIGIAVIEKRASEWSEKLASWSDNTDPLARLFCLVRSGLGEIDMIAKFGCPMGGLCQELGKQGGQLSDMAAKLMQDILGWTEEQLKALGVDNAKAQAKQLLATLQGSYLLTHTFKDTSISKKQVASLEAWLEGLTSRKPVFSKEEQAA